jgi:hypothetical protein
MPEPEKREQSLLLFSLALILLILAIIFIYSLSEKKRKKKIKEKFRKYTESHALSGKNLRLFSRLIAPLDLDLQLTFTEPPFFGMKAQITDISLAGMALLPDFPLKKMPLDTVTHNVLVNTPINHFVLKAVRVIRIEHQPHKRLLAIHIDEIDSDQQDELSRFVIYLRGFIEHGE